ncbi:hypothetical protein GP486_005886 [Trichoglossum hirsutum]|uniref:Uncharacterized protein n=1 Tax=Trichoglossum hirsutum TaxID=265104 RepID=A0A9P8L8D3_9PEZI|nr:hypothetical protein GP486_005886 [Trichoglossum hirsutum]
MRRLFECPFLAVLHGVLVASAPQAGSPTASSSTAPTGDPPVSGTIWHETYYCDEPWMKAIEAQAWADAYEISKVANEWVPGGAYQGAYDTYMGIDSKDFPYNRTIRAGIEKEVNAHEPIWIGNRYIHVYCGETWPIDGEMISYCTRIVNGKAVRSYAYALIKRGFFWVRSCLRVTFLHRLKIA